MYKFFCLTAILLSFYCSHAAFVPAVQQHSPTIVMSLSEFEAATGKKLNWMERMQFKKLQKSMKKGKLRSMRDTEELTEGFQFLPFIGSFLTLGILYLVMMFTAKDANALRWAGWGAFSIWLVGLTLSIISLTQGYY
jgi:hypothetical protein